MLIKPPGRTIPLVTHHIAHVNDASIHYVAAGDVGTPVLLVHGFPESWWAFRRLIPFLARNHRVVAVDLRGFGDSTTALPEDTSATLAEDLHALIAHLNLGPVHLLAQDISGATAFRLVAGHAGDIRSLTGVETGLAGYGLEAMADVGRGGAWYIGPLATPHVADAFFTGQETELIGQFIMPFALAVRDAVSPEDVAEFARGYARPGGWSGATALYGSLLKEGADVRALAEAQALTLPTLAVDRGGSAFTFDALAAVHSGAVRHAQIADVGHYIAQETPEALADTLMPFFADVDASIQLPANFSHTNTI